MQILMPPQLHGNQFPQELPLPMDAEYIHADQGQQQPDDDIIAPQDIQLPPEDQNHVLVPPEVQQQQEPLVRCSGRQQQQPVHFQDYVPVVNVVMPTLFKPGLDECMHPSSNTHPLLAYKAVKKSDPDTMYLWQAMKQPDWTRFKQAKQDEVNDHTRRGHWKQVKRALLPVKALVLPAVWSVKRK
jgi:hypothetical protein